MSIHNLDFIFKPKRIALIGVTPNPNSVGGTVLKNIVGSGFNGVVYPVNPTSEAVLGIQCYPDVASLPKSPDLAIICSPADQVPDLVRTCGESGIKGLLIMSAGFRECGQQGKALEMKVQEEAAKFDGMRIIGPNCLGFIVPSLNLNLTFAGNTPKPGHIAFISQSGALCTSVLDWAAEENIGFSYFVSIGNAMDVDFADLIDYFGEDEKTKSIILYIESIQHARKFMTATRAFARSKPIVAFKSGRFPESAEAASSHTGAMAAEDAVYDAAFQRAGIARVFEIGEIFDVADLIGRHKMPHGPNLAIVTNAGGPGVMATDALIASNGQLARLSQQSLHALDEMLPPFWSHGNPVDVLGDARSRRVEKAIEIIIADPGVDAVLVILTPQAMTNPTSTAKSVCKLAGSTTKPLLAAWLGGKSMKEGISILNNSGVATYTTPEQAVRAFMTLVNYSKNLESLHQTPKDIPVSFPLDRQKIRHEFKSLIPENTSILSESSSKKILASYGIHTTPPSSAVSPEEAVSIAKAIGYPVVAKILSPDITHKTDVGGVMLNLKNDNAVQNAFQEITKNAKFKLPNAGIQGITIQKMFQCTDQVEMILGAKKDPVFGSVILAGLGGTAAEIFKDRSIGFPPLNEHLARRMLTSLKAWPLLNGFRGGPAMNVNLLIETMMRLSYLLADYPEISELDINPLIVTPDNIVALDARIILDPNLLEIPAKPYSHLALRPYPENYVRDISLSDGATLKLRPIKPEDEPLWLEMLGSCSKESIYARFRYFFNWNTHDVAIRYCFIDYDREIAIVAEQEENGQKKLRGVGRLVANPDCEIVEYAVLITDAWQNRGLGGILTDFCTEIARSWNMKRMIAQTTTDNPRMVELFKKRNFSVQLDGKNSVVDVEKSLI